MYCIGLTGTIASGKSTAMAYFKSRGVAVLSADDIAKGLTAPNMPALKKISDHFGPGVFTHNGELNRRLLRQTIMGSPTEKHWLEALLHPLIRQEIETQLTSCTGPYCVIEIPLLLDRKPYPYLSRVLLITADKEEQIRRLMARDHCTKTEALNLLHLQEHNNPRAALADDYVVNQGSPKALIEKLEALHVIYTRYLSF